MNNISVEKALEHYPSLMKRKLDPEVMEKIFNVRTTANGALVVPLYSPTGLYVGDLIRTLSGEPKYRYVPEEANGYLYNYHRRPQEPLGATIVQESPFDVHALYPTFSVALVGVNADPLKMFCLSQLKAKVYILALDTDRAGIEATYKIAGDFLKQGFTTIVYQKGLKIKEDIAEVEKMGLKMKPGTLEII